METLDYRSFTNLPFQNNTMTHTIIHIKIPIFLTSTEPKGFGSSTVPPGCPVSGSPPTPIKVGP